jgi:UDP-GlcNAc3NAcA epimerase
MMRILSVIGARPQFIKAAPVSAALRQQHEEFLVHTGQHYDPNMSGIFFKELNIPEPDINLEVGSGSHATQTAQMMRLLETCIVDHQPDVVLVYGDTNSTAAATLVTVHLDIPLAHVEAGLRSYNRTMPEEINRVITDHASSLLFCPTESAAANLNKEGIIKGVLVTGDVMVDTIMQNIPKARESSILADLQLSQPYAVATIHRPVNTDDPNNLNEILSSFELLDMPVIFPIHPRTQKAIDKFNLKPTKSLHTISPIGYLSMLHLVETATVVITDSGGLQKEAYILKVPTITVRSETEWIETVASGWNTLVKPDRKMIANTVQKARTMRPESHPDFYGDGHAAQRIVNALNEHIGEKQKC